MKRLIESLLSRRTILGLLSGMATFVAGIPLWLAGGQKAQQKAAQKKREPLVIPDVPRDQVICFCLYTVHHRTLKLSAQLYPLKATEERRAHLETERDGAWQRVASQDVNPEGWLATFRVENWDDSRAWNYRVTHAGGSAYGGVIRKNPVDKDEIVVGNLSCNGNKLTMHAYANPSDTHPLATGYGLVRFNKRTREITIECWPRGVDVTGPNAKQFPGWPVTIRQEDNYSRKPLAYLPTLDFAGASNPVVQVIDESDGEVVYTLRVLGTEFRPKVFRSGSYTIKVLAGPRQKTIRGIASLPSEKTERLKVEI